MNIEHKKKHTHTASKWENKERSKRRKDSLNTNDVNDQNEIRKLKIKMRM